LASKEAELHYLVNSSLIDHRICNHESNCLLGTLSG
jgi:hypothetical protein